MINEVQSTNPIDWNAKGRSRVMQNVQNLLNIHCYDIPYDRTMGLDPAMIDQPLDAVRAAYLTELQDVISIFEPRAVIQKTEMKANEEGKVEVKVVIHID